MGSLGVMEILLIVLVVFGISLIPTIFYLLTIQNTLYEVRPENRRMEPGLVWLALIPVFGLVWHFIIVNNVADSLKIEFEQRGIKVDEPRPGIGLGLAFCILRCCVIIPFAGFLASFAGLICWILYWVKIGDYKTRLLMSRPR